jgi:hypothetical protein
MVCLRFDLVQRFASAFDLGDDVFGLGSLTFAGLVLVLGTAAP